MKTAINLKQKVSALTAVSFHAFVLVVSCVFVHSCKSDFDYESASRPTYKQYSKDFEKLFGDVPVDKSWDFSNIEDYKIKDFQVIQSRVVDGLSFYFIDNNAVDNEGPNGIVYYSVANSLENQNVNSFQSSIFYTGSKPFCIMPLFSTSIRQFDVFAKVGENEPVILFTKDWSEEEESVFYCNGKPLADGTKTAIMPGLQIEASAGTPVQLFLKYKDSDENASATSEIPADCLPDIENAKRASYFTLGTYDQDQINADLAFALIGEGQIAVRQEVKENHTFRNGAVSKRYMIENVGSADKMDYNDLVVDIYRDSFLKAKSANGVLSDFEFDHYEYDAYIRHVGDTMMWTLKIGDCVPYRGWQSGRIQESLYQIPDKSGRIPLHFEEEAWSPELNNLTVYINQEHDKGLVPNWSKSDPGDTQKGVATIPFPKDGEVPLMVAFDTDMHWRNENDIAPFNGEWNF